MLGEEEWGEKVYLIKTFCCKKKMLQCQLYFNISMIEIWIIVTDSIKEDIVFLESDNDSKLGINCFTLLYSIWRSGWYKKHEVRWWQIDSQGWQSHNDDCARPMAKECQFNFVLPTLIGLLINNLFWSII